MPAKFLALILALMCKLKSPNRFSNSGISLFKAMLQWLANCSIKIASIKAMFHYCFI